MNLFRDFVHDFKKGPRPSKVEQLNPSEMAEVFASAARGEVYRNGQYHAGYVYIRIDRVSEQDNRVTYFHYWVTNGCDMYKIGSGGYIPELHIEDEKIHEFEVLYFTQKRELKKLENNA